MYIYHHGIRNLLLQAAFVLAICIHLTCPAFGSHLEEMSNSSEDAIYRLDWKALHLIAPRYLGEAEKSGDIKYLAHALYVSSKADLRYSYDADAAEKKLNRALQYADSADSDSLRALIWRTYGMLQFLHRSNTSIGQDCLLKAAEYARKADYEKELYLIYGELSEICIAQKDTLGKKYATLVYDYGRKTSDDVLMAQAAYCLSYYKYMDGDMKRAMDYLRITEKKLKRDRSDNIFTVYAMYATLLLKAGRNEDAGIYVEKVLDNPLKSDYLPRLSALKTRMSILELQGRYSEAVADGMEALRIAQTAGIHYLDNDIYRSIVDIHYLSGDYKGACEWLERLVEKRSEEQRDINRYARSERQMALRMAESDKEADIKKLEISRMRWIIILLVISCVAVAIALWAVFRKKKRVDSLYTNIVAQQTASVKREQAYREKIDTLETTLTAVRKRSCPGAEGEVSSTIFASLCDMVEKERLWADPHINRDILAERLDTNRSYLSKIIRDNADMNLPQFLNQYRVREAVEILSKEGTEMTMEEVAFASGFNSKRVFLTVFRDWVGMSPFDFKKRVDKKANFTK